MSACRLVVPVLPSLRRLAAACVLLAAAAPRAADAQLFTPLVSYTFAGCFEVGGCHTARIIVGRASPILNIHGVDPSLNGMIFGVTHSLPAGTALTSFNTFPYDIQSATGTRLVENIDVYRGGPTCPFALYPAAMASCTGGYGDMSAFTGAPVDALALGLEGWTSSDWSPTHFVVRVTLGAPGTAVFPGDEKRSLLLPLVSTQTFNVVPEPSTVVLLGGGLAMLGAYAARRRRARA